MAQIIENLNGGRRSIRLNTDDVINIVREYQNIVHSCKTYDDIRNNLDDFNLYLPEDIF